MFLAGRDFLSLGCHNLSQLCQGNDEEIFKQLDSDGCISGRFGSLRVYCFFCVFFDMT